MLFSYQSISNPQWLFWDQVAGDWAAFNQILVNRVEELSQEVPMLQVGGGSVDVVFRVFFFDTIVFFQPAELILGFFFYFIHFPYFLPTPVLHLYQPAPCS